MYELLTDIQYYVEVIFIRISRHDLDCLKIDNMILITLSVNQNRWIKFTK